MKKFITGTCAGIALASTIALAASYMAEDASFKVFVNGEEFTSSKAVVIDGRTYLPLRAIGDALGVPVNWNDESKQVEVGNSISAAGQDEYSRSNPAPLNTLQRYTYAPEYNPEDGYTVSIRVLDIVRGEQAYNDLKKESNYPEPDEGYEYLNAKVAFSVTDTKSDFSIMVTPTSFDTYTSNNEECPKNYYVSVEPHLEGNLYSGGNAEGWMTVMVKKGDEKPKMAYGLDYKGSGGVWFALYK